MSTGFRNRLITSHSFKLGTLALFLLGACVGCGAKGAGSMPDLIPVKGKVTFKGQPLTTGTVHFDPDDYGGPATGQLQSDGTFVLTTHKQGDGVVAGHHRVYITDTNPKSKSGAVPKKYSTATTANLEAEVSPENTDFTFEIK